MYVTYYTVKNGIVSRWPLRNLMTDRMTTHNQPGLLDLTRYQVKIQLKLAILSQFFVINLGILDTEIIHLA